MKLVGISGSIIGAKTPKIVEAVLSAAKQLDPNLEIELVDLKKYNVEFLRGIPLEQ